MPFLDPDHPSAATLRCGVVALVISVGSFIAAAEGVKNSILLIAIGCLTLFISGGCFFGSYCYKTGRLTSVDVKRNIQRRELQGRRSPFRPWW